MKQIYYIITLQITFIIKLFSFSLIASDCVMGICYSEEEEWEAYQNQIRQKRKNRKRKKNASIIYEENSVYENSFASKVDNSFREDIFHSIQNFAQESGSILTGQSIVIGPNLEMRDQEMKIIYQSISKLSPEGTPHNIQEPIMLCNLKTKNFLHTHKVCFPDLPKLHEVACCPQNSNHILEYDIWKLIKYEMEQQEQPSKSDFQTNQSNHQNQEDYLIYHPFTKKFLNYKKGHVVCSQQKMIWNVISYGPRREGGFIKISCPQGQLCMTDERGLLTNHKKLQLCKTPHLSHLWQIRFEEFV